MAALQRTLSGITLVVSVLAIPSLVHAQAIGGTVSDSTGGVLPGVTVEARSPALIEQVRTAVTDGNGQYLIIALEAGIYSVTYTLPGFSTLVRDQVDLSTGFTANLDVQLTVGALEETVTVTQAAPMVDVQSVVQSESIDRGIYEVLPTTRGYDSLALLIPAMNVQGGPTTSVPIDTGGIAGRSNNRLTIHGSSEYDGEVHVDGFDVNLVAFEGSPEGMPFDTPIAEYVYDYSANLAEVETGGVRMNLIPKEGSNAFTGGFYTNFAHPSWLANNVSQEIVDRGLTGGKDGGLRGDQSWMFAPSLGGPIVEDRLWFFISFSQRKASFFPPSLFNNTDTSAMMYVPDLDNPTKSVSDTYEGTGRFTLQATASDKVQVYWSNNHTRQVPALSGSNLFPLYIAPESGSEGTGGINTYQLTWTRPQSDRILFEAGVSYLPAHNILYPLNNAYGSPGNGAHLGARTDLPGVFEFSNLTLSRNMGFIFRGSTVHFSTKNQSARASMSYVTGSHNLKVGVTHNMKRQSEAYQSDTWTNLGTFYGVPAQAYFESRPPETNELTNMGIYVQDQWTLDRVTVNAGVRFDYFKGFYPDHTSMPGMPTHSFWAPNPISFEGATAVSWKDLQPRLGLVYDLSGDGRTALKVSASRFGSRDGIAQAGELNPIANNIRQTRFWIDGAPSHFAFLPGGGAPACIRVTGYTGPCTAGDGLPQGDPTNPYPNGELLSGTDNPAFGTPTITQYFDPDWAFGWGTKKANWEFSGSVQHELLDNVSVDVGYFRRTYVNLHSWDNRNVGPADFDTYTITVPEDSRLPGGGGYPLTLVDMNPAAFGRIQDNLQTLSENLGGESEMWHGLDVSLSARLEGVLLQGGVATGARTTDYCGMLSAQPEILYGSYSTYSASRVGLGRTGQLAGIAGGRGNNLASDYCREVTDWQTNASVFGSYTFPYDIDISAAFYSRPGGMREAIYQVPGADVLAALGRPATVPGGVSLNVLPPGKTYGDRMTQLDIRFAKLLDFGEAGNLRASFDLYNLFNGNAVSREQAAFLPGGGATDNYLKPLGMQPGRLGKISLQYNF